MTRLIEKIDARLPQSPEAIARRKKVLKPIATIAVGLAFIGGVKLAYDALSSPEFSEQTTSYTFDDGEGLLDAAAEIDNLSDDREGVTYIESLPENKEVLSDGIQAGETITIPISASK